MLYFGLHRQRLLPVLVLLSIVFALSITLACGRRTAPTVQGQTVTDEIGRSVKVPANPQRIVSLAPSLTETLFALGLGDRIVGVTSFCDYPPEAKTKENVGDTLRPDVEKIVALRADLVIVSTSSQLESYMHKLDDLGIAVYVSNPRNIAEIVESIKHLGDLTGTTERARELSGKLQERINVIDTAVQTVPRPRVLLILGTAPLITTGGGTFINDLIEHAGGRSISADVATEYPQYSWETAVAARPEVVFLEAQESKLPERLNITPAAQSGRIYHIDDSLILRPGPRIIDGLEQMAAEIHPELFKSATGK